MQGVFQAYIFNLLPVTCLMLDAPIDISESRVFEMAEQYPHAVLPFSISVNTVGIHALTGSTWWSMIWFTSDKLIHLSWNIPWLLIVVEPRPRRIAAVGVATRVAEERGGKPRLVSRHPASPCSASSSIQFIYLITFAHLKQLLMSRCHLSLLSRIRLHLTISYTCNILYYGII